MKSNRILLGVTALTVIIMGLACSHLMHNDEQTISLEQAPAPVQAAIAKTLAGEKADKIVIENSEGKKVYEVTYHVNGQERSAEFTAAGEAVEMESDLEPASLPAAVSSAITKKYPAAKIEEAAEVTSDGQRFYEVGVKLSDGSEHEVQIGADGTIRADKAETSKSEK